MLNVPTCANLTDNFLRGLVVEKVVKRSVGGRYRLARYFRGCASQSVDGGKDDRKSNSN